MSNSPPLPPGATPSIASLDLSTPRPAPGQIRAALRSGAPPPDYVFDGFLPLELRLVSSRYWTPLSVVLLVSRWIAHFKIETVVDIGSGAGKFCVAAALAGPGRFTGLEQRPRLVSAARELARRFEVEDRVRFIDGSLGNGTVPTAEAYYLYNPFGENLFTPAGRLDEDVELGRDRFRRDVFAVEELLANAPVGTYLITYNGFGGEAPPSYRELRFDHSRTSELCLRRKMGQEQSRTS